MFCETESIIRELRKELATKDEIMESLLADHAKLEEKVRHPITHAYPLCSSTSSSAMIILPLALVLTLSCRRKRQLNIWVEVTICKLSAKGSYCILQFETRKHILEVDHLNRSGNLLF